MEARSIIDTDVLVDAARGMPDARVFLEGVLNGGAVTISIVSVMELIAGCRDASELRNVKQFASRTMVLPITDLVSLRARGLMEQFTLGHGLMPPDALIAATALDLGLPLTTRNVRHFEMLPGLTVVKPY